MAATSKTTAQHRADQIKAFQTELGQLERDQIISLSAEQRDAVAKYHATMLAQYADAFDIDKTQHEKQLSLGMRIASFLGALALAASVFFLFYQFWGKLTTTAQVAILIGAALLSFAATVFVAQRDHTGYFTKLIALVSFICFVLNISMLGQIFNITPSDTALIPWAALAFVLAYAFDMRLLLAAGIVCVIAFLSARMGEWGGVYWLHFGERPENFLPAAVVMFALPHVVKHRSHPEFAGLYHVFGLLCLFLPMQILSFWGYASYLDLDPDTIEGFYQIMGFILSAGAIWLGIRKGWGEVTNTGTVFFVIFLYTKLFDWWWEIMPKYLFFLVLGLCAVLCLLILKRLRGIKRSRVSGAGA